MGLTPLEIRKNEFGRRMRGLDPVEVKKFLEQAADEMEGLLREKAALESEMNVLKDRLSGYIQLEESIQKTLLLAQQTSEEAISSAKKQADLMIEEARNKGREIESEFTHLKSAKRQFVMEFETLMEIFRKHIREFGNEEHGGDTDQSG